MRNEIIDWTIITINFLIFIYIFLKTANTDCFNIFDTSVSLFGLGAGLIGFLINLINRSAR